MASVGAAVGLGNALRFPGLCAKYGGGAFLLIYIAALLVLGIPLLNAEIALGRKAGGGAPDSMESLARGGARLGWAACGNSVFTAVMYAGLAGWILCEAFAFIPLCLSGAERGEAGAYFFENILQSSGDGAIYGISLPVSLSIGAVWAAMFFCLKGGAGSLSRAAKFTVFIPMSLLSVIAVRGLFYSNSGEALKALFLPDFSKLSSPELWINALGQVFFSLSLAVGIMPAYGAYLPPRCGIFPTSIVIAAADALVSIIASVALFTTLYGCGLQEGIGQSGIITAFSVYPAAIVGLFENPVICGIVGSLFYISLAMMAIQSGVSMLEAALSPTLQKFRLKRGKSAAICCVVLGICSLAYATTAGDILVEIGDRFVNFYNVLVLCVCECLLLGFSRGGKGLVDEINRYCKKIKMPRRIFALSIKFLNPIVLICLAVPEILKLFTGLNYPMWAQFAFGWGVSICVVVFGVIMSLPNLARREVKVLP